MTNANAYGIVLGVGSDLHVPVRRELDRGAGALRDAAGDEADLPKAAWGRYRAPSRTGAQ